MTAARAGGASMTLPIVSSAILHVAILGGIAWRVAGPVKALPPLYRVELIAAPAGPRAEGAVTDQPAPEAPPTPPKAAETKRAPTTKTKEKVPARKPPKAPPKAATPNERPAPAKTPAPKAGGGEVGGTGADVANVLTAGIEFPFPGYLNNVVRQITLNFEVPRGAATLSADVSFLIHRDGTVTGLRLLSRSGSYVFDQSCLGAVEAAARAGKFGPLPQGFTDDVLPVIFSFDPKRMR